MNNPDLTSFALGMDLTTWGLNLNASDDLHKSMPREEALLYAAHELHARGWYHHKEQRLCLTMNASMRPLVQS